INYLDLRPGFCYFGFSHAFKLLEVFRKHISQFFSFGVIGFWVTPGIARNEDFIRNARYRLWNSQIKDRISFISDIIQVSVKRFAQHFPRIREGYPMDFAMRSAGPSGINKPYIGAMLPDFIGQQLCIDRRVQGHKWRSKTCRKSGLWLGHSALSACYFGRISANKVIHSLLRTEFRDRREYAKSIAGQKDNIAWMATGTGFRRIRDIMNRVRAAHILGISGIAVVGFAVAVQYHIFKDGSGHLGSGIDQRLTIFGKINCFSVAPAFDIEYAVFAPAVLIIADENTILIGGKGCFSGSRESKKDSGIAVPAHIRGAVHSHNALFRQQIVHYSKDSLFYLPGV